MTEEHIFDCRYGYFSGDEYVITDPRTPRPWVNVISNGDYGLVVSQTGAGYSWRNNAGQNRITRAYQDLVRDDWGRWLYIRDLSTGAFWSATWNPVRADAAGFQVRHGVGHTLFKQTVDGIASSLLVLVAAEAPVEIWRLTLRNEGRARRTLDVTSYFEWILGFFPDDHREFHKLFIDSRWDPARGALLADKHLWGFPDEKGRNNNVSWAYTAFHAAHPRPESWDGDKETFLGMYGRESSPAAMRAPALAGTVGRFGDGAAALRVPVALEPGEEREVVFTVGAAEKGREDPLELAARYTRPDAVPAAMEGVKRLWAGILDGERVSTPDPGLDLMSNAWLKYQAVSGRIWGKTGYYQTSAGWGFRDQLQDSLVFLPTRPDLARRQLLAHAGSQFPEGDVLHWWYTIRGGGPRTKCSDDFLWMPFVLLAWLDETDDPSVLDQAAPFVGGGEATLYEHCTRSLELAFSRVSPRGVPLMGDNDWNDGLSAVGTEGRGESFWVGEFLYLILEGFIPVAESRGDSAFAERCRAMRERLRAAVNEHGWDGEWYMQSTTDAGLPIGSRVNDEGRLFLNPQTWAVISGIAPAERAASAMNAVSRELLKEHGALLLTPAYTRIRSDIGYITRYAPGLRENGGVYTHAAAWAVWAYALMRDADRAWRAYRAVCPPNRTDDIERYLAEPYVAPGNTDGPLSPLFGRGGWTWYTGSAQWLHRVATQWLLGVRPTRKGLVVDPLIPAVWDGFSYTRRFRGATYEIRVENPAHVHRGVARITVDGSPVQGDTLPDLRDGAAHAVVAVLGG